MPQQKVTITIDENGQISASTSGFSGEICMNELEELLGAEESFKSIKPTDEFNAKTSVKTVNTVKQGAKQ